VDQGYGKGMTRRDSGTNRGFTAKGKSGERGFRIPVRRGISALPGTNRMSPLTIVRQAHCAESTYLEGHRDLFPAGRMAQDLEPLRDAVRSASGQRQGIPNVVECGPRS